MEFATQSIAWQYIHPVNLLQKSHLNAVPPKMIARLKEMRYLCDHNYDKVVTVGGLHEKFSELDFLIFLIEETYIFQKR